MIELTIQFDRRAFDEAADAYVTRDVQRVLVDAVNRTASKVQAALKASMLEAFDRPKPFTLDGVKVFWATPRADGGAPSAMIFLAEEQAAYLDLELHGGVRRASDIATTRLGPLVPGP